MGQASTNALGINNIGQVVGEYTTGGQFHGYLLSGGIFITIDPPGSVHTQAFGINDSGQVVGSYTLGPGGQGFLATPTTPTPEPGTWSLMVCPLALLAGWSWRRRRLVR